MLLTISGPSTVGKDSAWLRIAKSLGFTVETPYTTRPRRPSEADDLDHHHVTVAQFQEMIRNNELTAWDYVLGNYYGTASSLRDKVARGEDLVLQVLGRMALRLKRDLPSVCTIMLATSEQETLEERLLRRGYSGDDLRLRVLHGVEEAIHAALFDFVVPDADIMTTVDIARTLQDVVVSQRE